MKKVRVNAKWLTVGQVVRFARLEGGYGFGQITEVTIPSVEFWVEEVTGAVSLVRVDQIQK